MESNSISDPPTISQRLFDGFLTLDKVRVDLVVIENREGLVIMN